MLYEKTKDEAWHKLEMGHYNYIIEKCLKDYKWEGQFEDVAVSVPYQNHTHFTPDYLIEYTANHCCSDEKMIADSLELMRFIEDQFVVWGEHPDWNKTWGPRPWAYPAGLEQYYCYCMQKQHFVASTFHYLQKLMSKKRTLSSPPYIYNLPNKQYPFILMKSN